MKIKRIGLTVFNIILILSIGLVSVNLPNYAMAQNEGLAQDGSNGESDHDIEQLQVSKQNNQVISGDGSIASGNNILCQTMNNIDVNFNMDTDCQNEGLGGPRILTAVDIRTFDDQGLRPSNILVTVTDSSGQEILRQTDRNGNVIEFFDPNPIDGPLFIKGTYTNGHCYHQGHSNSGGKINPYFWT